MILDHFARGSGARDRFLGRESQISITLAGRVGLFVASAFCAAVCTRQLSISAASV